MASTISSRPSHYDALGLSPAATQDEIARAFGKAMGLFGARSAAAAARLGLAFETLRNPEKRRAYDESIGLKRDPAPAPAPMAVSFRISARPASAEPHVEAAQDPTPTSFIASSLREIARPVDLDPSARPAVQPQPLRRSVEPPAAAPLQVQDLAEADDRPIEWKRPAIAVGTVLLAAGLVGALAGVSVKGDLQSQAAVTTVLPAAKPSGAVATSDPAAAPVPAEMSVATAGRPIRAQRVKAHADRAAPDAAASLETAQAAPTEVASDQPAADPLAPQGDAVIENAAAAGLPLASKLVARTIEHIGYACGEVASTSAVDGAAGVYKVTCTSGESYRAAPVHGRYRFKRW